MAELSEESRRDALKLFVGRLRRLCVDHGAKPALVVGMDARSLLTLYGELVEQADADRRALDQLMRQPPGPGAAA